MEDLKYSRFEHPPIKQLLPLSIQHMLTMLGACVAVPTIMAGYLNLDPQTTAELISNVLLVMGIATIIQTKFGAQLPIIQGSSFAFLPAMIFVVAGVKGVHDGMISPSEGELAMRYIAGAVILGAIFQFLLGFGRVAGAIQKLLSPVVIGPVIMVIGLSLFESAAYSAGQDWALASATIVLIFFFAHFMPSRTSGTTKLGTLMINLKTYPVLLSVFMVYGYCLVGTLLWFPVNAPGYIDFSVLSESTIVKTSGYFLPWGTPLFDPAYFVIIFIAFLVSTMESLGDYNACAAMCERDGIGKLTEKQANDGIMVEGIGCLTSVFGGGFPTTSYSENIGLIGITRVASLRVTIATGCLLIVAGLLPIVGKVLASIPAPVMGGLYCVLFGMITGIGLQQTARCTTSSMRNLSIIGVSLFVGFVIPHYLAQNSQVVLNAGVFKEVLAGVGSSQMAVTAIVGLLLDNLIKASPAERGLTNSRRIKDG